jgi:hypothetical protein
LPKGLNRTDQSVLGIRKFAPVNTTADLNHAEYSGLDTSFRFNSKTGVQASATLGNFNAARPNRIVAVSLRFPF